MEYIVLAKELVHYKRKEWSFKKKSSPGVTTRFDEIIGLQRRLILWLVVSEYVSAL